MDPYALLGTGIAAGLYRMQDRREKKQTLEEEFRNRMALLQEQSRLQDQELTPEQKLMRMYQQQPDQFKNFRQAMDPNAAQEMALKSRALDMQNFGNQMDAWRGQYQVWKDQYGPGSQTAKQRDFQFLMQMPGMTQDKALQMLYRPDLMSQFMMMGGMGGINPMGGGTPTSNFGQ